MKMRENRAATVETSNSSEFTSLKSQIDMLGKQLGGFMQQVTAQAADFVQPIPTMHRPSMNVTNSPVKPMQWQQNSKPSTGFRPKACFNCGDPSHIKPQCPLLQPNVSNTYQTHVNVQTQESQQQGCFTCGDPSHFKRNCPQWLNSSSTFTATPRPKQRSANTQQNRSYGSTGKDDCQVYINATIEGIPV